jgi:hypothetical protein
LGEAIIGDFLAKAFGNRRDYAMVFLFQIKKSRGERRMLKISKIETIMLCLCLMMPFIFTEHSVKTRVAPDQLTTIYIDPTPVTASVCTNFTVAVDVRNVIDLYCWQFKLSWNPNLLECIGYSFGPFLTPPTIQPQPVIDNVAGTILAGDSRMMLPGVSGSGTIFYIEFHCDGPGECDLTFITSDTFILDSNLEPIPHTLVNGHVIQTPPTIFIDPTPLTTTVCSNFTVAVNINDVTDLYGWQICLTFNPNLMECLEVTEGPFLKSTGRPTLFIAQMDNNAGWVTVACCLMDSLPGVSGSGTLMYIKFHCDGPGQCDLVFSNTPYQTFLFDHTLTTIPHTATNGHVIQMFWKPSYPDYAPSGVPDFCQHQDTWGQPAPLYLHTMGLIDLYDPLYTPWHELYPTYCREYYLTSWKHHTTLSPSDHIDMTDEEGWIEWFHVDEVTVDIVLKSKNTSMIHYMEFTEGLYVFDRSHPVSTWWHELYPYFCRNWHLTSWEDTDGNCLLGYCDQIDMTNEEGWVEWFHVENLTVTIQLTSYWDGRVHYLEFRDGIDKFDPANPMCTWWHEVYPDFCHMWQLTSWEDSYMLSPSDQIDMMDITEKIQWYHVDQITVTLQVTPLIPLPTMYIDFEGYIGKLNFANPVSTQWHEIYPVFSKRYHLMEWYDINGSGQLDSGDVIILRDKETGETVPCNVDVVSTDLIVTPKVHWTWCGPCAVANSLWWLDSAKELNAIPPPAVIDNYPLVRSYTTGVDDHDKGNVPPFIEDLATYMDTDGRKTGLQHFGTRVLDMQAGIAHYISNTGLNPRGDADGDGDVDTTDQAILMAAFGSHPGDPNWNLAADFNGDNSVGMTDAMILGQNFGKVGEFYEKTVNKPAFEYIERQLYLCEDVVLLLGFWQYNPITEQWTRFGGHYVTAVGVDSRDFHIAVSDPFRNNAEDGGMGRVLPLEHPYPHCCLVHNNATFVSHDIYQVAPSPSPGGTWGLKDYVIPEPLIENFVGQNSNESELSPYIQGLPVYTEIEYAVVVSCKSGIVTAGSEDHNVYAWDFSGNLLWTTPTIAPVLSVALDNNGSYVAAGSRALGTFTGALYFINAPNGAILWTKDLLISDSYDGGWKGSESKSVDVKYNCYNQCDIVAAAHDGGLNLYDQWGRLIWQYSDERPETIVRISQDGNYIICASYVTGIAHYFSHLTDGISGWGSLDGIPVWTLNTSLIPQWGAFWVAISGLGDYVAISGSSMYLGYYVTLWDGRTGTLIWFYNNLKPNFIRVDMPCDGRSLVAVNDDPSNNFGCDLLYWSDGGNGWDSGDGTPIWSFWSTWPAAHNPSHDFYTVAISGDGSTIAAGGEPRYDYVLSNVGPPPLQTIGPRPDNPQSVDLTFNGKYGASVGGSALGAPAELWFFSSITGLIWTWTNPSQQPFHCVAISKTYPCMFPYPNHDVDVHGLEPFKTIVCRGYRIRFNVTLSNEGSFNETAYVRIWAQNATSTLLASSSLVTLTLGAAPTITLEWTPTDKGNYTIFATIGIVQGEIDVYDNTYVDGVIQVVMVGDVDPVDGYVGIDDIFAIALRFGTEPGGPPNSNGYYYSPIHDINDDDFIGIDDIFTAAQHFAEEDP